MSVSSLCTSAACSGCRAASTLIRPGSYAFATGVLLFVANVLYSRKRGAIAGPNPWDAPTLEWSVPSPTPVYNFAVLPSVASRHPLWEERLDEGDGKSVLDRGLPLDAHHETLGTSAMDGEPDIILKMPSDSYAPFLMTLCISAFFSGLLIHWWWLVALAVLTGVSVGIVWLWPRVVEGGDRALPA
jgi:hypothetical protein